MMKKTSDPIRILLIRHGETEWNRIHRFQGRSDQPLNQRGKEQARALAKRLQTETVTAFYSSPLSRAAETARIIAGFHDSPPLYFEEGLIEMELGDFDGMPAKQWTQEHPEFVKAWREDPSAMRLPGGETLAEVQHRGMNALERITRTYPTSRQPAEKKSDGPTLVIVSHNFVILSILCFIMQLPLSRFRTVRQETAALNVLFKEAGVFRVDQINSRSHLQELENQE